MTKHITVFAEDSGHEAFLAALLEKIMRELDIPNSCVKISYRSVRGGLL